MSKTETIEAMAKAFWDNGILKPWDQQKKTLRDNAINDMQAAYAVARDAVLEEANAELAKHAVEIEGTPYSCGPREWVGFIDAMKGSSK